MGVVREGPGEAADVMQSWNSSAVHSRSTSVLEYCVVIGWKSLAEMMIEDAGTRRTGVVELYFNLDPQFLAE